MKNSKKEFIIGSFQKMDWNMLDILLDENKTYQDAKKDVFLEKIEEAFSILKRHDDTILLPYEGFCNSEECSNKGCKGYSFVGNNSKQHIDLIFEELDDDINDIYHCSHFKTNDISVETENLIAIDIKNDERADFKPSIDFLIKSQKCKSAYEELYQYQNKIINKEVYIEWLDKFYNLYKSFDLPPFFYSDFNKFHNLYYKISLLNDFLQSSNLAKNAIKEFQTIDKNNEQQLLKWLIKHEETGDNLTLFLYEDIDFEYPEKREYFEVENLKIDTSDFKYIANFKFHFDEHYWNMLEKHTTFSNEESIRYLNENNELSSYVSSLSYHLNKRGYKL
jgi:hypothetical protein